MKYRFPICGGAAEQGEQSGGKRVRFREVASSSVSKILRSGGITMRTKHG